jgi:hypothetical protein
MVVWRPGDASAVERAMNPRHMGESKERVAANNRAS